MMAVMVAGFATVAGGVMAAYVGMLHSTFPDIAGHLLAASVMGAPASLVMAKIMVPETETPETSGNNKVELPKVDANFVDAISRGTSEGLTLALNVAAKQGRPAPARARGRDRRARGSRCLRALALR